MLDAIEEKDQWYLIYISKSKTLLNRMTFRTTPKEKPHKLKGKPFCMTLAYQSV